MSLINIISEYTQGVKTIDVISEEHGNNFAELLKMYVNDRNSSTLREIVTTKIAGAMDISGKRGYDAEDENGVCIEIKPRNCTTDSKKIKKLNGSGNFSDFTWSRYNKMVNDNPFMVISGFVDGMLIYVIKFRFNDSIKFKSRLNSTLSKQLPNGDISTKYVRSVEFNYQDYITSNSCEKIWITQDLELYKDYLVKKFYKYLCD